VIRNSAAASVDIDTLFEQIRQWQHMVEVLPLLCH